MWFFPISTGFSILDIPLTIFAFWFFWRLFRSSKKKPQEPESTPEQIKKWEEETHQNHMKLMAQAEGLRKQVQQYIKEGEEMIRELEKANAKKKKKNKHRKHNRKSGQIRMESERQPT